ncbi:sigma factor-like helix-turn-helix DNA-binding protein [Burkholderia cepacia]|uniref:sigma factor-like helix-turn-helix DNA-binding protein n=1 Tax=Burkholderia cepacia TaxID=292 RepID=UPI0035A234D5
MRPDAHRRRQLAKLPQTLDGLPAVCREAYLPCRVRRFSIEQAARSLGLEPAVVRTYLVQAQRACHAALS